MSSDFCRRLRVLKLFWRLNLEILSFDIFLVCNIDIVIVFLKVQAFHHFVIRNRLVPRTNPTFLISPILKLILQIIAATLLCNIMSNFRIHLTLLLNKIVMIITLSSMNGLIFNCSFLCSLSKCQGHLSVGIVDVSSSAVWAVFGLDWNEVYLVLG